MKTMKITISNPNPYKTEKTDSETGLIKTINMVSYVVTGDADAVAQYRQDQLVEAPNSITADNGQPLKHFTAKVCEKYGVKAELERAIINGKPVWFMDNEAEKQLAELIQGSDTITQKVFAEQKIANLREFAKTLADNKKANITALKAKSEQAVAEQGKGIDTFVP